MTADVVWAAAGLARTAAPNDSQEPILSLSGRSREPVLIEDADWLAGPDLLLPQDAGLAA